MTIRPDSDIAFEYDPSKVGLFERAKFGTIKLLYGQYPPLRAINYIWESKAPKGTMVSNPYTDRVMMIVVESGGDHLNQWVAEERNIYEDYKRAFGEEPPMISGIAIDARYRQHRGVSDSLLWRHPFRKREESIASEGYPPPIDAFVLPIDILQTLRTRPPSLFLMI